MESWIEKAEELKFRKVNPLSWTALAYEMHPMFPELTEKQTLEKVRGALRKSDKYEGKQKDQKKAPVESTFTYSGKKKFFYKFDHDINLYGFGDLHLGAESCLEAEAKEYLQKIYDDPIGYVIIPGDLIENAVQGGKSAVFSQTMSPQRQKETAMNWLKKLADEGRILFGCSANHEERTIRITGSDVMYDMMNGLGLLDRYNFTEGYITIEVPGKRHEIYCTHNFGKAETKLKNKARCFMNVDLVISGHIHDPRVARIAQKLPNGKQREILVVVINAWLYDEHYGISAGYEPVALTPQVVHLGKKMVAEW